jgi:RNA polymerase sigma factor (sigma-70 family)
VNDLANKIDSLIINICNGDNNAFKLLYQELNKPIFILALSILKNRASAEDVMQETFLRVKLMAGQYKPGTNAKAWVLKIAQNLSLQVLKKNKREVDSDNIFFQVDSHDTNTLEKVVITEALKKINLKERQIVILYSVMGLKHFEIANMLDINYATERWYYTIAVKKLKKAIGRVDTNEQIQ